MKALISNLVFKQDVCVTKIINLNHKRKIFNQTYEPSYPHNTTKKWAILFLEGICFDNLQRCDLPLFCNLLLPNLQIKQSTRKVGCAFANFSQ